MVEVYIEDVGATYDAPLATVLKYRASAAHGRAHRDVLRNFRGKALSPTTFEARGERKIAGRWTRFVIRSTEFMPLATINEERQGPWAGSKIVFLYTPHGRKTRVDVFGWFRSRTLSASALRRVVLATLRGSFEDDVPMLRVWMREQAAATK